MARQLQGASKLEMRAGICFLWAKRCNCSETYRHVHEINCENAMSGQIILQWSSIFENERTDIVNAGREAIPWPSKNVIAARVNNCIFAYRHIKIEKISNELFISHGSVHEIIAEQLNFIKFVLNGCLVCCRGNIKERVLKVCLNFYNVTKGRKGVFEQNCERR